MKKTRKKLEKFLRSFFAPTYIALSVLNVRCSP